MGLGSGVGDEGGDVKGFVVVWGKRDGGGGLRGSEGVLARVEEDELLVAIR